MQAYLSLSNYSGGPFRNPYLSLTYNGHWAISGEENKEGANDADGRGIYLET